MAHIPIRDVSLFVKIIGSGYPVVVMHGGPGADYTTVMSLRGCANSFKLIFYDHRCNGRSRGADVTSFTWDNLTADADALRQALGFEKWAVLGHSFGGMVAMEYALRYPDRVSHLVLMDTGGDTRWSMEKAPETLASRGYSPDTVELARKFLNGAIEPDEMLPSLMKLNKAYFPHNLGFRRSVRLMFSGIGTKLQPETMIYARHHTLQGWTVMNRLGEIKVPTLIIAGRDDFIFPPEHQEQLAAGISDSQLLFIENAGHNPHEEWPDEVNEAVRNFLLAHADGLAT
jgi:pimeloyl-ACP methyl ester carboxylesterase